MCIYCFDSCGICDKSSKNADIAIECDNCLKWYHTACIKMPLEHYNALNSFISLKVKGLLWLYVIFVPTTHVLSTLR